LEETIRLFKDNNLEGLLEDGDIITSERNYQSRNRHKSKNSLVKPSI